MRPLPQILVALAAGTIMTTVHPSLAQEPRTVNPPCTIGSIERLDPQLDELIDANAKVEQLSDGHLWTEGPAWVKDGGFLLFSDIPRNSIYKWKEGEGLTLFLRPSGYTGDKRKGGKSGDLVDELGSNGLTLDGQGRLVLCQHGDRCIARLDAPLSGSTKVEPKFTALLRGGRGSDLTVPTTSSSIPAAQFISPTRPTGCKKAATPAPRKSVSTACIAWRPTAK